MFRADPLAPVQIRLVRVVSCMADREAFTIEIFEFDHDRAFVVDREIGGSRRPSLVLHCG